MKLEYKKTGSVELHLSWESVSQSIQHVPASALYPGKWPRKNPRPGKNAMYTPHWIKAAVSALGLTLTGVAPAADITFALDGPAAADTEIGYRLSGTASASDYSIAAPRVVIPAGKSPSDFALRAVDDKATEALENVIVTLTHSSAYAGDGSDGTATVAIVDNYNLLVNDALEVYYTFEHANLAAGGIRNESEPEAALKLQSYMHSMPTLAPGLPRCGDGLSFPEGRELVASSGGLRLANYTVSFWFNAPEGAGTIGILQSGTDFCLKDGALPEYLGVGATEQPLARGWTTIVGIIWPSRGAKPGGSSSSRLTASGDGSLPDRRVACTPARADSAPPIPPAHSSAV